MPMKRILRMSVVTTVIACGVLYGQRALVSAAPAGEAAAGPAVIADAEKPNRPSDARQFIAEEKWRWAGRPNTGLWAPAQVILAIQYDLGT